MSSTIILLLISPLVGFLINGVFGKLLGKVSSVIACVAILISLVCSVLLFSEVNNKAEHGDVSYFDGSLYEWISAGDLSVEIGIRVDSLTLVMLLVITGVGFLIHVYSIGYMHDDHGYARYFSYLNLFVFSMLILVLANNYVMMFIGWEGVGLCSYLLIGFWYEKKSASDAGKKAFIVNRIGDFGFLLGIFTLFAAFGSFGFEKIFHDAETGHYVKVFGENTLKIATLLLFVGAIGKSAQIPLYVWLPDAMEGPTPVSALIHAATMVTAGVYMIARSSVLFSLAETGVYVAWIGVLTALLAATMAITANDIKRVLAYSTVSQLGYMMVGVGVGAYVSGVFHLVTHAFFKGLMFLAAGSVMHAMSNELDMRKMGGLKSKLPVTYWTFLAGALAIAGVPGLSGFWSKDEILHSAWDGGYHAVFFLGLVTAALTAFYMFRLIFVTFHGKSRVEPHVEAHLHESPPVMWVPLVVLAVPSLFIGLILGWGGHDSAFHHFLGGVFHATKHQEQASSPFPFMLISTIVAAFGIISAYILYSKSSPKDEPENFPMELLTNKYYIDEIYDIVFVKPIKGLSQYGLWRIVDVVIIDFLCVGGVALFTRGVAGLLRYIQTGVVQSYILSMVIGIVLFLGYYLFIYS